jgi:hypothetical protein
MHLQDPDTFAVKKPREVTAAYGADARGETKSGRAQTPAAPASREPSLYRNALDVGGHRRMTAPRAGTMG